MKTTNKMQTVFVQVVDRPARQLLIKPGRTDSHYFAYCEEVGCDPWEELSQLKEALGEPMGLWLPEVLRPRGCSSYVQGVEVAADFAGPLPTGMDIIALPACKMMIFQGPPFADKDFEAAISSLWDVINDYDPAVYGFAWAEQDGPRFQLRPEGYRGYIEGRPVRQL